VSLAVIVLLVLPGAQRHFARDHDRPVGVAVACAVGWYFGACTILSGLVLMIAGTLGDKYVWWGLATAAVGTALLALNRPLSAGRNGARVAASLAYAGYVVLGFVVANETGAAASPNSLIPLGVALMALGGLWVPAASQEHFRHPRAVAWPVAATVGVSVAVVLTTAVAGVGFHAAGSPPGQPNAVSDFSATDAAPPPSPSDTGQPSLASPSLDESTARDAADAVLSASPGSATVDSCDGSTVPDLAVAQYEITDASAQGDGTFRLTADATLDDGTTETLAFTIGADGNGQACLDTGSVQTMDVQSPAPPTPSTPPDDTQTYSAPGGLTVEGPAGWVRDDSANIAHIRDYVDPSSPARLAGAYFRIGIGNESPSGSIRSEANGSAAFLRREYHARIVTIGYSFFLGTTAADVEYAYRVPGTNDHRHGRERIWRANGVTMIIQSSDLAANWSSARALFDQLVTSAGLS